MSTPDNNTEMQRLRHACQVAQNCLQEMAGTDDPMTGLGAVVGLLRGALGDKGAYRGGHHVEPPPADDAGEGQQAYRVIYEIDVYAASPRDAALQVENIFHDPGCEPMFTILDSAGNETEVDLFDVGLEERYGPVLDIVPVDDVDDNPANPETPA